MKNTTKVGAISLVLIAAMAVLFVTGCPDAVNSGPGGSSTDDATLTRVSITSPGFSSVGIRATGSNKLGTPAATVDGVTAGNVTLETTDAELKIENPTITTGKNDTTATVAYATGTSKANPGNFGASAPSLLANGDFLFVKVTSGKKVLYYVIKVTVKVGTPGGAKGTGFGVPDPDWKAKYGYMVFPNLEGDELLTEDKMPAPSYWNNQVTENGLVGHIHMYPDPFHFANGNRVTSIADWENRRKEIQLIYSYYGKGRMPDIDPEKVDIWLSGTNNTTINLRHRASGRTASFSLSVTSSAALQIDGNEGKLYMSSGNTNLTAANANTLTTGNHQSSLSRSDIATLFGINQNLTSRDSATGMSAHVVLAAIEGTDDPTTQGGARQATKQYFYPTPDATSSWITNKGPMWSSGYSTGGKQAYAHVMGIGRNGGRFGFADVGDSGALGAAIERFAAVAGLRRDITVGEALSYSGYSNADVIALGLDPSLKNPITGYGWPVPIAPKNHRGASDGTEGTLGTFADLKGVPYYTYGLQSGRTWNVGPGAIKDIAATGTANLRMVRGWAPYWEDFDRVPNVNNNFGTTASGSWANAKTPYVPFQHTATEPWSGIQQWMQGRGEDATNYYWHGELWKSFSDLHDGLDLDHTNAQPTRSKQGFGCTMPWDTYYCAVLNAPYGTNFIRSGVQQTRTNQPSMWAAWLIADEVYKFFGEQEYAEEFNNGQLIDDPAYPGTGLKMGWDKYIWRNATWMNFGSHQGTTEESNAARDLARLIRTGAATTETASGSDASARLLALLRDPMFSIDDPVYYLAEWCKFDWGRPGAPTIAERVRRRVEPNLKDYFMGEQYHAIPASGNNAATYHDAAKAAYTPTGTKWKRMDWRGLIDTPEPEL